MPPPPRKKITPLVEKIFFHEKSLGNDIPCKLSKSVVPTPSERWKMDSTTPLNSRKLELFQSNPFDAWDWTPPFFQK